MSSHPDSAVTLHEITVETLRPVLRLEVTEAQRRYVAPNAVSIAEAHFEPKAWFRAIHAGITPVGFVMLSIDEDKAEYHLWRFMIATEHQRRGFGRAALLHAIDHVRTLPRATELLTSVVEGEGSPRGFYESLGFVATGEIDEGETVLRLAL